MQRATLVFATVLAVSFAGAAFADEGQQSGIPIPPVQAQPDDDQPSARDTTGKSSEHSEHAAGKGSDAAARDTVGTKLTAEQEGKMLDKVAEKEKFGPMTAENVLNKLHMDNQKEIAMGQLAVQRGNSEEVRAFGERLIKDHQQADELVKQVAAEQNITLQESDPKADQKHEKHMAKMQEMSGEQFDKHFLAMMDKDHTKTLALFRKAQSKLENDAVDQLISQLEPTIREHDQITDQLRGEMDVAAGYEFDPQTGELKSSTELEAQGSQDSERRDTSREETGETL